MFFFYRENNNAVVAKIPGTLIKSPEGLMFNPGTMEKMNIAPQMIGVKLGDWQLSSAITYQHDGKARHINF